MCVSVSERLMAVVYVTPYCSCVTDQDKWFAIILFPFKVDSLHMLEHQSTHGTAADTMQ